MKYILAIITAVIIASASGMAQQPVIPSHPLLIQGGPGIVVSGSALPRQLPQAAQQFLKNDYPADQPSSITRNYIKDTYHVTLAGGTRLTFDAKGQVTDIIAPKDMVIPLEVIADILPQKTSIHLAEAGLIDEISEIQNAAGRGTIVMTLRSTPPRLLFDLNGNFIMFYD